MTIRIKSWLTCLTLQVGIMFTAADFFVIYYIINTILIFTDKEEFLESSQGITTPSFGEPPVKSSKLFGFSKCNYSDSFRKIPVS